MQGGGVSASCWCNWRTSRSAAAYQQPFLFADLAAAIQIKAAQQGRLVLLPLAQFGADILAECLLIGARAAVAVSWPST
jgi:hypothetical protein